MRVSVSSFKNIVFAVNPFRLRFLLVLCVAFLGVSFAAFAQQTAIVGTVTDPSGAVVPNVTVTITNTDTGVSKTYATNDAGQYVAPDLVIGHYVVKAEAKGFKASEQKNIVLNVGDRIRADFQMQLGAAQETVTVEANTVQVQTDSGERSNLITDQQMSQIAINGRSIYQLAALTPGASSQITGFVNTPVGGNASVEFNGMRQNHNIYLLDGGEDDDRGGAGGMSIAPSSDAIAEFRALTSNYSADYGLSSAGTMTMVLKSGTSQFHASAWEFNRNDFFDARNFFVPKQELRLNVYGFNVGGPVTFGHLYNPDKKKTFFFYNMEWRKLIQGGGTNQTVPATATYAGNFTGFVPADAISKPDNAPIPFSGLHAPCASQLSPALQQLFITAGQAFSTPDAGGNCTVNTKASVANNPTFVPFNASTLPFLNANAQLLLKAGVFPANNATASNGAPEFRGGANTPTDLREEVVRIDHNFTDKFSIFGHFIAEQVSQGFATSQWSGDNLPTVGDNFGNPSYSAVVHTTYTISPTLVNEVAFNYNGNRINIIPYAATGLGNLGLPSGWTSTRLFTKGANNLNRIPNIDLNSTVGAHFEISSWPWKNKADDYQIRDDVSWTHGAHQFKIGGSWAIYKKVQDLFGQTQGGFGFNGSYTGNDFADYLLGLPNSYQELAVQDSGNWNNVSTAFWFQDNWRVNHRLTLNLGLRWDGVPHTYEANNRMGNFYPQLYDPTMAATFDNNHSICSGPTDPGCSAISPGLGTSPNSILAGIPLYLNGIGIPGKCYTSPTNFCVPKDMVNNHWAAFGPRLGFAYDVTGTGKTVVRGGFGIMYERIQGNDMYNAGPNIPFSLQVNQNGVEFDDPNIQTSTGNAAARPINAASLTGLAINNYNLPVSYQYSIGVQHALSSKSVLTVSYVGNQGRHQNDYRNVNLPDPSFLPNLYQNNAPYQTATGLPFPGFTTVTLSQNEANTHYNGLQVDLNAQLMSDLTLRAMYTLSKAVDPTTGGSGGGDLGTVSNPYAGWVYDNGLSGYDRKNVAVVDFIYDIPLFRHSESRMTKSLLGGWEVSGIVTMESGLPLNVTLGGGQGGNGVGGTNRPDLTGTLSTPHTLNQWFSTAAFAAPTAGAWGTFPHNGLRGPGMDNWNLSLFKNFTLSEARGSRLELRLETFNTWNHTEFNGVSTSMSDGRFGQVTSTFDPRILQLGGKIYF
ncbi:MAG TPA: carboxypeptidase-like regulatory domain-containing protein [Candidatus Acidoferrum sp.]|nr:carboxypeptidase-like regulatory domain-containing protein [Candidatus Acidoferrum sp.]